MGWQTYSTLHPDAVQEMCGRKVRLVEELPRQLDGKILQIKKNGFFTKYRAKRAKKGKVPFVLFTKRGEFW